MLKLYNSLGRKKQEFKPLKKGQVLMYNCGPTVYSFAHIGNFRAYVFADLLRRYLKYKGYEVKQVMNITDVGHMTTDTEAGEDKMELAARREKKDPYKIAKFYEKAFHEDVKKLNLKPAHKYPRATEHIKEMIATIKKLIANGYAYVSKSGSVYFDVTKFKNYGQLSGNTLAKLKTGARIEPNPEKKHPWDFALWIEDPKHIMYWSSPWGKHGYPGWHIECSTMSMKYLGHTLDIHTGGEDNKFPHHECEIAQSEGATGKKFVNYWLHNKHLIVESEKMSKSKGNFFTLRDLLDKKYDPRTIRYLLLATHYRQQLNFTFNGLEAAKNVLETLDNFIKNLRGVNKTSTKSNIPSLINSARSDFGKAMDDDLNISEALAAIFDFIREINKLKEISKKDIQNIKNLIFNFDKVLGLNLKEKSLEKIKIPSEIKRLIQERENARKAKDWQKADEIRAKINQAGFLVEDSVQGPKLKSKK